ncbi:MFP1 [Symbiodinium microadriaticum]|nr:MFP1 [Symbiodinium microadriaticum]
MLVPGKPVPIDVTMHGFSCRNALAAMSIGHLPALHTLFVGLVDARRLMLDWQIVATPDGWLHVPTLLAACGSHLPAAWEAYIVGDVDAQEWLPYSSGDIFQVESRPTDAANHAASAYDSQVQEDAGAASTQPIADSSFTARHPETAGAGASNGLPPAGQGGVQRALPEPTDHAPARPADVPVPSSDDAAVRSAATSDYVATALLHARGDKCRSPALQDFHRSGIGFYTSGSLSKTKPLLLRSEGQRAATAVCIGICGLLCCMAAGPGHEGQELQSFAGCLALSTIYQAHRKLLPACLFVFMLMSCTTVTATSTWHPALYNAKIHAGESMCELSPVSSSSIVVPPPATRIRLIPTPCNGRSPRSADLYHPSPLRTLLEESLQASDNRAMFLAATLLDTLVEHFAASPVATASEADELFGATTTRPVLHLDELVPLGHEDPSPNTFASSVASQPALPPLLDLKPISASAASISTSSQPVLIGATPLGFAWNDLGSLFDFHPETKPWSAFFPVQHPKSRQVQAAMQILREDHPAGQVYCYTDGSFYPGTATRPAALGWACMFVDATHGRCAWVAGPVPAWLLSEERPSAFLAECAALIFGKVIAATVQRTFGLIFRSDCQAAIGIAAGTAAHRDSAIPSALANASAFCRYTHPHRDTTEYVPGHSGHFFNEVVDEIAKWGAQQQPSVYPPLQVGGTLHSWLTGGARALSWAGLAFQSLCGNWSAPPLHGDLGTDQDHAGLSPFQLVEPFIPSGTITRPHDLGTDTHLQFQATVVSYNTLSLGASLEDAQGKGHEGPGLQYRPGRAAILAEQLHNIGATIVALQETRCPEGRTTIGKYIRLSAGAVKGQLGPPIGEQADLREFGQHLGASKAVCFLAWRGDATMADNSSEDNPLRCAWMRRATFSALALRYQLAKTCRALRGACRADRDFYVSELARQVASNPSSEVFAALHRLLCHKRKKPFAPEPLPRLIDANGETCPDAEAANNRWREYFGAMEGGTAMDFHSLPVAILASPPPSASWPAPACAGQLPSVADLQKVMVCTKAGKAPGPDGIPGMLLKHFAPDMSILTYPLLLKLALRGCESVGFKGGLAVKFWKGKGSKQEASSYRQILLMSNLAKSVHQALRPALRDLFTERAPALQLGGKPGCSVVYGAHITRSFLRWQSTLHNSCFILFTDIASAFYSVVRQLVAKAPTQLAQPLLEGADLTLDDLEALRCHLEDDSALTQIGASSWLEALSQQLTQDTWFLLQHDHFPVLTSKGTRPGSSWADLLFAFVVKKITDRRDALLAEASPRATAPLVPADCAKTLHPCDLEQGLRPLTDLTWADDIATMRVVTSASQLLVGVKTTIGASCDAFSEHGFRLSYGPRKTAALAQPAGTGARDARRVMFGAKGCQGKYKSLRPWMGYTEATTTTHTEAHPQAPPDFVPGYLQPGEGIDYDAAISAPLLHELSNLDTCEEDCVWEVVSSHIAPIEVLRCTVRQWAQDSQLPDAAATAHNMLLLLDPDLLGETQAKPSPRVTFDDAADKVWAPMPPTVIRLVGKGPPCKLVEPPAVILPPSGHCSLTLRQATAYATWLEQACAAVASCLSPTAAAPVSVSCKRLEFGLGIASSWLRAAGATFHADGLDFARG